LLGKLLPGRLHPLRVAQQINHLIAMPLAAFNMPLDRPARWPPAKLGVWPATSGAMAMWAWIAGSAWVTLPMSVEPMLSVGRGSRTVRLSNPVVCSRRAMTG